MDHFPPLGKSSGQPFSQVPLAGEEMSLMEVFSGSPVLASISRRYSLQQGQPQEPPYSPNEEEEDLDLQNLSPCEDENLVQNSLWAAILLLLETACFFPCSRPLYEGEPDPPPRSLRWLPEYVRSTAIMFLSSNSVPLGLRTGDHAMLLHIPGNIAASTNFIPIEVLVTRRVDALNYEVLFEQARPVVPIAWLSHSQSQAPPMMAAVNAWLSKTSTSDICAQLAFRRQTEAWKFLAFPENEVSRLGGLRSFVRELISFKTPYLSCERAAALDVLFESVGNTIECIFGVRVSNQSSESIFSLGASSQKYEHIRLHLEDFMMEKNWCPARLEKLFSEASTTVSVLASALPSYDDMAHPNCSHKECRLVRRQHQQQPLGHVSSNCDGGCEAIVIDETQLSAVYSGGGVPGLRRNVAENGRCSYAVCDVSGACYIAISHVSSHGMGNGSENMLNACQLELLFDKIGELSCGQDPMLWIDTLSVPINPIAKGAAIQRLHHIYQKAWKVLVIDRCLMEVGDDWLEQRLQLLSSEWQRRLWTMHEGQLAKDVYVQFKTSAVSAMDLMSMEQPFQPNDGEPIHKLRKETGALVGNLFTKPVVHRHEVAKLIGDLRYKNTSDPSDEAVCIAVSMGLPLKKDHPQTTIERVYRALQFVPRSVMFFPGPRLHSQGLRWAPASLLGHRMPVTPPGSVTQEARVTAQGLLIESECVCLQDSLTLHQRPYSTSDVYCVAEGGNVRYSFTYVTNRSPVNNRHIAFPVILLERDPKYFDEGCNGILVSLRPPQSDRASSADNGGANIAGGTATNVDSCHFELRLRVRFFAGDGPLHIPELCDNRGRERLSISGTHAGTKRFCID